MVESRFCVKEQYRAQRFSFIPECLCGEKISKGCVIVKDSKRGVEVEALTAEAVVIILCSYLGIKVNPSTDPVLLQFAYSRKTEAISFKDKSTRTTVADLLNTLRAFDFEVQENPKVNQIRVLRKKQE